MSQVLQAVFGGDGGKSKSRPPAITDGDQHDGEKGDVDVLDELSLNESLHYKEKVSKYLKTTLRCVRDVAFWYFMFSGNALRNPLLHFYAYLCTPAALAEFMIVQFVCTKIPELAAEFDGLCSKFVEHIFDAIRFASKIPGGERAVSEDTKWHDWITGSLAILLHNSGAFNRRVTKFFSRQAVVVVMWDGMGCARNSLFHNCVYSTHSQSIKSLVRVLIHINLYELVQLHSCSVMSSSITS